MRYEEDNVKRKRAGRRKRALRARRRLAFVVFLLSGAMAALAAWANPTLALYAWGAAAGILLIETVLLIKRRGVPVLLYVMLGLLSLSLIALGVSVRGYVMTDGALMPTESLVTSLRVTDEWPEHIERYLGIEQLDLRKAQVEDFSPVTRMRQLKSLDARGNYAFTEAVHDQVAQALPDCHILWSYEIAGQYYDSDVTAIDLSDTPMTASEIRTLQSQYPDIDFTWSVSLMGKAIAQDARQIDLKGAQDIDPDEILSALSLLDRVERVDLRGTALDIDTVKALVGANDRVRFLCTYAIPGGVMDSEAQSVTLPGGNYEDLQAAMAFIPYMPSLQTMDARSIVMNASEIQALQEDPNAAKLIYNFTVYGQSVNTLTTQLNLDNTDVGGLEAMEMVLNALPKLEQVSMVNCGLSQADMITLCEGHPEIHFIWEVEFGQYRLRTDATAFTTNLYADNKFHYTSETFQPLKYCTDLQMLDLGHCDITDIGFIAGMKHLKVLILADNDITDISVLSDLTELEYVELFLNKISDFSPLASHTRLLDLNIYYNPVGDIAPLTTCTALERLWLGQCGLSSAQIATLRQALPNCKINAQGSASTGRGWRDHKRYTTLKEMYKSGSYIPFT